MLNDTVVCDLNSSFTWQLISPYNAKVWLLAQPTTLCTENFGGQYIGSMSSVT